MLYHVSLLECPRCRPDANQDTSRASGAASHQPARLDTSELGALVQELFTSGLAKSTQKAYKTGKKRYLLFCASIQESSYSVSEQHMSAFVAFLYQHGLSATMCKSYLAAVRHAHIALGLGDPVMVGMTQLQYILKAAHCRLTGMEGRTRLPITPAILRQLRHMWESHPSRADAVMLWAATTLFLCLPAHGRGSNPI